MPTTAAESQFDELGSLYEDVVDWPFRRDIELPAVLHSLGDLTRSDVLDFGCGAGLYTRLLAGQGARRVVGYDESEGMLREARHREAKEQRGIEYVSQLTPALAHRFDVVLSVYVLPYVASRDGLRQMCASMARMLRPGGRLLALPLHPDYDPHSDYYTAYGFRLVSESPHVEGSPVRLELRVRGVEADVTAYYWSRGALEEALHGAGFGPVFWAAPWPPGLARIEDAPTVQRAYLRRPHAAMLDCRLARAAE
ncbi:Methyltransferase domain-containing protein [Myxococcus fulvus]|uniref:Methyltransferase n=1 Tax=Myxococcus fulvus TaxID=33 RepID=A0A511T1P9_MYXFU|nr:methyltransferase domain-containing protein [Myxococcus fulvus]GEN08071.1 methyltransferase [Myxococcus fulvus]SEU23234.1 Methyltransferase domain-containing protein [Myxococcus fulvus]